MTSKPVWKKMVFILLSLCLLTCSFFLLFIFPFFFLSFLLSFVLTYFLSFFLLSTVIELTPTSSFLAPALPLPALPTPHPASLPLPSEYRLFWQYIPRSVSYKYLPMSGGIRFGMPIYRNDKQKRTQRSMGSHWKNRYFYNPVSTIDWHTEPYTARHGEVFIRYRPRYLLSEKSVFRGGGKRGWRRSRKSRKRKSRSKKTGSGRQFNGSW